MALVSFALPHHGDDCTSADTDVLNDCLVAEPVPSWQRVLWKYAFLGGVIRGRMKQMMGINAENVRAPAQLFAADCFVCLSST